MMSAKHPLAEQPDSQPIDINALQDESLIGPRAVYQLIKRLPALQQVRLPRLRYDVSNYSTIFSMVRENLGIALVPGQLLDAFAMDGIVIRSIEPALFLDVHLAGRNQSPAVVRFMEYARTWAQEQGYLPDST
jgi:DNA-binding transcriptional LysR family regulator